MTEVQYRPKQKYTDEDPINYNRVYPEPLKVGAIYPRDNPASVNDMVERIDHVKATLRRLPRITLNTHLATSELSFLIQTVLEADTDYRRRQEEA